MLSRVSKINQISPAGSASLNKWLILGKQELKCYQLDKFTRVPLIIVCGTVYMCTVMIRSFPTTPTDAFLPKLNVSTNVFSCIHSFRQENVFGRYFCLGIFAKSDEKGPVGEYINSFEARLPNKISPTPKKRY